MFVSKSRSVVYPQSEHARLAGTIAQLWGNEKFRQPQLPFNAFCTGVALHDFGYGLLDTHDILGMEAAERHRTFEALMQMRFSDHIAEIVAKTHVARLMNMAGLSELEQRCRLLLKDLIAKSGIPESVFQDADMITRLCDSVAFDFCFERVTTGSVAVLADNADGNRIDVRYEINFQHTESADGMGYTVGTISLEPWPLSCESVRGYLLAYEGSGYPQVLNPHRVEFEVFAGSE
ncbi:DUF3891 family protein [Granulosicoccus antarcticus]|uniref:HD domain-containing protein n=1 Tax=Granulosicoccus antarcticus IMCC3135 TaxID=1192854 RepID=A0A2Z2NXP0_9GAMM|nr:DUF3891 family protein [Granulosicoccus antarcticus]ASJ76212.1 hypothetical protein IMCC3135_30815 [Granulosicoccus antarcticus IMCC3135]